MRLQKATRCALFAVLELAQDPERQIAAADIADKYKISVNHLAKVLRDLARAGLVTPMRGAGGGYRLQANPKRTTLFEIIQLFEDFGHDIQNRAEDGDHSDIGQALKQVTNEIDNIAISTMKSITLSTLLKRVAMNAENDPV